MVKTNSSPLWKKKILTYDRINHILVITDPTSLKAKTCNLTYFLYRLSKNEDYKCFVLESCDKRVSNDCRSIHIGFKSEEKYNELFERIQISIKYRVWQMMKSMFAGDAGSRNSVNSVRKQSFSLSQLDENLLISTEDENK